MLKYWYQYGMQKIKTEVNLLKEPREQVNPEPGSRTSGIVMALLLFLCIVSVAFYTYQKSLNPSSSPKDLLQIFQRAGSDVNEAEVQYRFDFDSGENPVFAVYKDYIVKCDTSGIWFMDRKGDVVWSESIAFGKPAIKVSGSRLLAADIGSGGIYVLNDKTIRWQEKLDTAILNADISEDGYVTVITSSKRDNNEVRVFDPNGIELFRKIIANDFAVSACISPSEKTLAVSGISAGTARAYSNYKFYNKEGEELADQAFDATGELLPIFWYNHDDSIYAVGDSASASIDKTGKLVWEKQFKRVAGASPAGNAYLAAAVEDDAGAQLKIFDKAGKEISSCSLQGKPEGLNAIKGTIAVNTYDTVYFYNEKCKSTGKYSAASHVRQVCFLTRQQAVIICDGSITVVNMV